jgi:hypothetical protein
MPFDLPAEHVLPLLDSGDPRWAMEARSAWDCLTASGDVAVVTLHDLEYFLWYQLPAKFMEDLAGHREVAKALADLLSGLGYEDAAAVSRGLVTMRVLAEWDGSRSRGIRAFRKAMDESGVEPPDTDALEWGDAMGVIEAGVYHAAAAALEEAMSDGAFVPGRRGWRQAQAEVVRTFLTTRLHSLDERTPLTAVRDERRERWARRPARPLRQALLKDVMDRVRAMPAPPAGARDGLRSLARFLEVVASSPRLTQAGYLPPGTVRELTAELGWQEGEPRGEADVPQLMMLRDFAHEAGLIRKSSGRLVLTDAGRRSVSEPAALWERVVSVLAAGQEFVHVVRELALARLLRGPDVRDGVEAAILPILIESGWRPSDGSELTREMVSFELANTIRPMRLVGVIETGEWPDRSVRLTELGAVTAAAILWRRSTAPDQSVS